MSPFKTVRFENRPPEIALVLYEMQKISGLVFRVKPEVLEGVYNDKLKELGFVNDADKPIVHYHVSQEKIEYSIRLNFGDKNIVFSIQKGKNYTYFESVLLLSLEKLGGENCVESNLLNKYANQRFEDVYALSDFIP